MDNFIEKYKIFSGLIITILIIITVSVLWEGPDSWANVYITIITVPIFLIYTLVVLVKEKRYIGLGVFFLIPIIFIIWFKMMQVYQNSPAYLQKECLKTFNNIISDTSIDEDERNDRLKYLRMRYNIFKDPDTICK